MLIQFIRVDVETSSNAIGEFTLLQSIGGRNASGATYVAADIVFGHRHKSNQCGCGSDHDGRCVCAAQGRDEYAAGVAVSESSAGVPLFAVAVPAMAVCVQDHRPIACLRLAKGCKQPRNQ